METRGETKITKLTNHHGRGYKTLPNEQLFRQSNVPGLRGIRVLIGGDDVVVGRGHVSVAHDRVRRRGRQQNRARSRFVRRGSADLVQPQRRRVMLRRRRRRVSPRAGRRVKTVLLLLLLPLLLLLRGGNRVFNVHAATPVHHHVLLLLLALVLTSRMSEGGAS